MLKKEEAKKLRISGLSYNEITRILKVPKGTLSYWFKDMPESLLIKKNNISKAKQIWANNITNYNKKRSIIARNRWAEIQKEASLNISNLSNKELKLVGITLYWAEGYKKGNWHVIFSNSDVNTHKIMIKFFTKICNIPIDKITCQIQMHDSNLESKAIKFWSRSLKISKNKFIKTCILTSKPNKLSGKNLLPFGTLRIRINDVVLLNKIKGWIIGIIHNI